MQVGGTLVLSRRPLNVGLSFTWLPSATTCSQRPFLRLYAVTVALIGGSPGKGDSTCAWPVPIFVLFGHGGSLDVSRFLHCGYAEVSIFVPAGKMTSNSRAAFGWWLFSAFWSSDELVENEVPTDVFLVLTTLPFLLMKLWLYVVVV